MVFELIRGAMKTPSGSAQAARLADDYRGIRQTTRILAEPLSAEDAVLRSMSVFGGASQHLCLTTDACGPFTGTGLAKDAIET